MKKLLFLLMAFSLVFALALPCFANYETDNITDECISFIDSLTGFDYVVLMRDNRGDLVVYSFEDKPYATSSSMFTTNNSSDAEYPYVEYRYDSGWLNEETGVIGGWIDYTIGESTISLPLNQLLWSKTDIKQGDTVVFAHDPNYFSEPLTLEQTVQNAWTDTINNDTIPYLSSAILALVVAGVCIIAMFVVLKLIGKRTLINR